MCRQRRFISYFLLVVLGLLSVKSAFYEVFNGVNSDCQEFAHIHLSQLQQKNHKQLNAATVDSQEKDSKENDCHEGKSVLSYSPFPVEIFTAAPEKYVLQYEVNYNHENTFNSPDLEPLRKPPKYVSKNS